jgi:hypothetical protein
VIGLVSHVDRGGKVKNSTVKRSNFQEKPFKNMSLQVTLSLNEQTSTLSADIVESLHFNFISADALAKAALESNATPCNFFVSLPRGEPVRPIKQVCRVQLVIPEFSMKQPLECHFLVVANMKQDVLIGKSTLRKLKASVEAM